METVEDERRMKARMSGKDGGRGRNETRRRSATDLSLLQDESWSIPAPASIVGWSVAAAIPADGPALSAVAPLQCQSDRFMVSAVNRRHK